MLFRSDRKSTRLNSSHTLISYAVFCLKKKKKQELHEPTAKQIDRERVVDASPSLLPHSSLSTLTPYASFCSPPRVFFFFFFFNDTATTEIYTLPLHDALRT